MQINQSNIFPIMGDWLVSENSIKLDFSNQNADLLKLDMQSTQNFNDYVFGFLEQKEKKYGHGGYLENRMIYQRSTHFQQGESRCMHLGVDVWCEAFHPLYAPLDAKVHSFADNNNFGDYGPTIILEHELNNEKFYTLYGHLSRASLENLAIGDHIKKGRKFSELGPFPENGDWPPHLHFQLISDIKDLKGDFPGVCAPSELEQFKLLCPDPNVFIIGDS
ncbi:peptidoglycan DD-metalloendopeptidase family protein [Marivirga salinae]|uniref:Peptidoglycan DD-metalloendopeptidase family protein n=1 Tax=Marivirga salinarum TaxID=3059078 RepID=A0AA51R8F3_9BACT|nr:peptidoglycan DD-metalloendopeptidase family protein [Marivirga sp. BDSF4-3]WMN11132.1 peptidoglycan DD-metalloendopeptidase family protein [Marivirga sp. BDSF4-3]